MKKNPSTRLQKTPALIACLDDHSAHCGRLKTLAGLLALCLESGCPGVDPELVGSTGDMLLRELEELDRWRDRLGKELEK